MATLPTFVSGQILTAAALNAAFTATRTDGAWTAWTTVFTANFTKGNAVDNSSYFRAGNFVIAKLDLTLGTTSSVGTLPVLTLPVAATGTYGGGTVTTYRDVSASADFDGFWRVAGAVSSYLETKNVAGANDGRTGIAAAVPFTWATGDLISGYLAYEAAP